MKIELDIRDELLEKVVLGELRNSLECCNRDIEDLKAKEFLKEYEREDLKYTLRLAKALRLVISCYSVIGGVE